MHNKEIARAFRFTAQLMELHDENPFKVKSYTNAAFKIERLDKQLIHLDTSETEKLEGIGKSLAVKIREMIETGSTQDMNKLLEITPGGIIEMFSIKGIGPKKIAVIWKEIGIESVGELLYACYENRLVEVKGFGAKTQQQIKESIEFAASSSRKFHYAEIEKIALETEQYLENSGIAPCISLTGSVRRKCEIIEKIEILVATTDNIAIEAAIKNIDVTDISIEPGSVNGILNGKIPLTIYTCTADQYYWKLFETTAGGNHCEQLKVQPFNAVSEEEIYLKAGAQYIEPELREGFDEIEFAKNKCIPQLVKADDLKGILHNHSTYSDGLHSLEQMAVYCRDLGYEYFGICDHSQSAYYAKGLKPEKVSLQHTEIDRLNQKLAPFRIFKGIESDILNDGSLDYPDEILKTFDFIIASVHSNLRMTIEKATARIIKAVENPYTTILGHPTGRLLLARAGYPLDHQKVIDACAANGVAIELNAHPYRLDLDWRWIRYATEKGVMISVNPDAHQMEGFHDMRFGICVARKGYLTSSMTLNALTLNEIQKYFLKKKSYIHSL